MITAFRKRKTLLLRCLQDEGTLLFRLERGGKPLPMREWRNAGHEGAAALIEHGMELAMPDTNSEEETFRLPEETLMEWMNGQERHLQRLLALPPLYDGGIQIDSEGMFHQPDFSIRYLWQKPNGQAYTRVQEEGCFITVAGERRLLPSSAWRLTRALRQLQDRLARHTETAERMADWHEVQQLLSLLPEEERQQINQSSVLRSVRLFYANAFRFEAVPGESGYDIAVTLLRQKDSAFRTESSSVTHELLLTPADQEKFSAFFAKANSLTACTPLDVGRYVILDPNVHKLLQHVHTVRRRPSDARLAFLKNPRAALMQELGNAIDEDVFAAILSDRVVGLGVWQEKVVPYIQLKGQQWIPDGKLPDGGTKGIRIGNTNVPIKDEEEARNIISECAKAREQGKTAFIHKGEELPATLGTEEAVSALYPVRPKKNEPQTPSETQENLRKERTVIIVKENFDDLTYEAMRKPRTHVPPFNHLPEQMRTSPKPHQKIGFDWLCERYRSGSRGALLADDMGLGKTWQALAFMAWLRQGMQEGAVHRSPILIVAPTGLLRNWQKEITDHLKDGIGDTISAYAADIAPYRHGSAGEYYLDTKRLQASDLILTTYETLNNYQVSFAAISCAAVIFDEMQKVKNPASQITGAANSLKADFWIGMTGTPVENRLCDLWCITDILQPGWLGSVKDFSRRFEKPLAESSGHEQLEELNELITRENADAPAYMLRRMKEDELEGLPKKHIHTRAEPMASIQAAAYSAAVERAQTDDRPGSMLRALHDMRAISLHPDYRRTERYADDEAFIASSARVKTCFKIMEEIRRKNEKALIFVEYDCWHQRDFLPAMLKRRFGLAEMPMIINGGVQGAERQARVERFQNREEGFDVMLISPKAGGVGLTLTAANHVIHLTRWWNPAVEDQATDRVYRIGQKREVHVYYPMAIHPSLDSFDSCLHELLESKRRLSRKTLLPATEADTVAALFTKTVRQRDDDLAGMQEIAGMTGQQFQSYVLSRLSRAASAYGLHTRHTPSSWDGGADMILETDDGEILAVIQCKHSGNPQATKTGSDDARRAFGGYGLKSDAFSVVITNARASAADRAWHSENPDRHLLVDGEEACRPERILKFVAESRDKLS
ncbi:MAG: SNF2-related protein [Rickettsiales bacterium]